MAFKFYWAQRFELLIETCKISVTLYRFSLFEKGASEGDVPIFKLNLRDLMHIPFSNPKRRKDHI